MPQQILLVEGPADQTFYDAACREAGRPKVKVTTPNSLGAPVASKTNAIHRLPLLVKQLEDGSVTNLGIVVDADYQVEHGLGFAGTLDKIRDQLNLHGFERETRLVSSGFEFLHSDGLPSVGAWIMPDNKNEGMLEDFIQSVISDAEQSALHKTACAAVSRLSHPLFKPIHRSKAEVATWLAWQQAPGAGLENVIGNGLINFAMQRYAQFQQWLHHVFA